MNNSKINNSKLKKFEEFVGAGSDEFDSAEWPGSVKAEYEEDREKRFTKSELKATALRFGNPAEVESEFDQWFDDMFSNKKRGNRPPYEGPTNL